ncbi:hypothetical protein C8F04DRAFT_1238617 [Mycena alexandri]|uniref:Uncharacterized protein n=1 Tax=Mycena alexandri TaxID=1745969 RepID=A0AAD6SGH7_9AGAR|nr:hypothetical protein C8F04DRAFT_1238617 [Mycena alexandri]
MMRGAVQGRERHEENAAQETVVDGEVGRDTKVRARVKAEAGCVVAQGAQQRRVGRAGRADKIHDRMHRPESTAALDRNSFSKAQWATSAGGDDGEICTRFSGVERSQDRQNTFISTELMYGAACGSCKDPASRMDKPPESGRGRGLKAWEIWGTLWQLEALGMAHFLVRPPGDLHVFPHSGHANEAGGKDIDVRKPGAESNEEGLLANGSIRTGVKGVNSASGQVRIKKLAVNYLFGLLTPIAEKGNFQRMCAEKGAGGKMQDSLAITLNVRVLISESSERAPLTSECEGAILGDVVSGGKMVSTSVIRRRMFPSVCQAGESESEGESERYKRGTHTSGQSSTEKNLMLKDRWREESSETFQTTG